MKKKAQKSTRNRHTGRVNAFKQQILDRGRSVQSSDREHISALVGNALRGRGTTNIRI